LVILLKTRPLSRSKLPLWFTVQGWCILQRITSQQYWVWSCLRLWRGIKL